MEKPKIWKKFEVFYNKIWWNGYWGKYGIGGKEDVKAYKSGNAKSFGSGINNIIN